MKGSWHGYFLEIPSAWCDAFYFPKTLEEGTICLSSLVIRNVSGRVICREMQQDMLKDICQFFQLYKKNQVGYITKHIKSNNLESDYYYDIKRYEHKKMVTPRICEQKEFLIFEGR